MDYKEKYEMALEGIQEILGSGEDSIKMSRLQLRLQGIFPELKESQNHQDSDHPNGCIVLEDFNGGDGFYKVNLDYLNKKQIEEIEKMVKVWNKESNSSNENIIKACIGMCLTDADEQRFKDYNTNLKDCLAWLKKQGEEKPIKFNSSDIIDHDLNDYCCKIYDALHKENGGVLSFARLQHLAMDIYGWCKEHLQGEQKPADIVEPKFKVGDRVRYKGHMCDGVVTEITDTDYICGNAKLPISTQDKLELIEQKSAELDGEDKTKLMRKCVHKAYQRGYETGSMMTANKIIHEQEWSEDDNLYYDDICEILMNLLHSERTNINKAAVQKDLDWLGCIKEKTQRNKEDTTADEIINYFKCQSRDEPSRKDTHNKWISWVKNKK